MTILHEGDVIQHGTKRDVRYRVTDLLGSGGFGEAYAVLQLDENDEVVDQPTCLKVTKDGDSWHGEAYFMGLLRRMPHVVQMQDAFPAIVGEGQAGRMIFCIEMDLVQGGTVDDLCESGDLPWPTARVARQIRLLLGPLATLHNMQIAHRDITPQNVFIGPRSSLLLGDYGITKAALLHKGVRVDAANWAFTPKDLKTFWDRRDDIYQVGLLAMTLLTGEVQTNELKKPAVNAVTDKGALRDALKCALSVKSQRFVDASEMAEALKGATQ